MGELRAAMTADERARREKQKRLHAEVHKLTAEVKKLRKELRYAGIALTSREEQLVFFERHAARATR